MIFWTRAALLVQNLIYLMHHTILLPPTPILFELVCETLIINVRVHARFRDFRSVNKTGMKIM